MKNVDDLVNKALEYKAKGLNEKEIGDELHLSVNTVTWLLTRGVKGAPPKDVKIGWRSVGIYGSRIAYLSMALSDIIMEEMERMDGDFDSVMGIAINGIPFASFISENLEKELIVYRPPESASNVGAFSSNYANPNNKRIVIIDDVLSTGDTIKAAISALKEQNGKPMLIAVIVNKTPHDSLNNIPLRALIRARAI